MAAVNLFRIAISRHIPPTSRTMVPLGIAFLVLVVAAQLLWPLVHLPFRSSAMYNKGWNAVHAARAMSGQPLYPSNESFMFNNYPPLSFYIVGLAGRPMGEDAIMAGRIISLLAILVVAANVAWTVRNLGGTTMFASSPVYSLLPFSRRASRPMSG
jgi:hypothetical protein